MNVAMLLRSRYYLSTMEKSNFIAIQDQLNAAGLSKLPVPDDLVLNHHYKLYERMRQLIAQAEGALPFDQYMQAALYEPGLGYYVSGMRKFGEQGDFITAPEISSVFGDCIAIQCQEVFLQLEAEGHTFDLLEIGPGSGKLGIDLMAKLSELNCLPDHYYFLELSPDLQQRQKQLVAEQGVDYESRFVWLNELPQGFRGVIVGNELLDAMPVKRFHVNQGVKEWAVGFQSNQFYAFEIDADADLKQRVLNIESNLKMKFAEFYSSEVNMWFQPWLKSIADCLEQGVVLLIDYGYVASEYYHEQRVEGTLICNYRHHAHDNPLLLVGLQDLSAFVDFSAVAEFADESGLKIAGYCPQAQFLIGSGLDEIAQLKLNSDPDNYLRAAQEIKHLTLPSEMGERFKAIALSKKYVNSLRGFKNFDQVNRL